MMFARIDPYQIGQLCGFALFFLLAIKSFQVARKPGVQPLCLIALGLLFLIPVGIGIVELLGGESTDTVNMGVGLLAMGLVPVSVLLAIMGLVQLRTRREQYQRGRPQAIIALALVALLVGFTGYALQKERKAREVINETVSNGRVTLEEFNLGFAAPLAPWVQLDPRGLNPFARYGIHRGRPEVYLIVIPEIVGAENQMSLAALGETVRAGIASTTSRTEFGEAIARTAAGIPGEQIRVNAHVGGRPFHYAYWYGVHQGLNVQVLAWGLPDSRNEVATALDEFLEGMKLLDPEKIFTTTGELLPQQLEFPSEGFRLSFERQQWLTSETLDEEYPAAAFTASSLGGASLQVVRLDLKGLDPDMDAIVEAFFELQNMVLDEQTIIRNRDIETDGPAMERELIIDVGSGADLIHDHYRIRREGDRVYMINTWISAAWAGDHWNPARILDSLDVMPTAELMKDTQVPPSRRKAQGLALNEIGLYYFNRSEYDRALSFFTVAAEMDPEAPVYLGNVSHTLLNQGNYEETVAKANTCISLFPDYVDAYSDKAQALAELGRSEEAAIIYADVVQRSDDDDLVLEYLNLLIDLDREEEATEVIQEAVRKRPSPLLRRWEVQTLKLVGEYTVAEERLLALGDETGWNLDLFTEAVLLFEEQGDFNRALEWVGRQEDQVGVSFESEMARGRNELNLGWYHEAAESFQRALRMKPYDIDARGYVDYVNTLLGKGSSREVHANIEPVALVPELTATLDAHDSRAARPPGTTDSRAWWERIVKAYDLSSEGVYRRSEYRVLRVETRQGVNDYSTIKFPFDPTVERIFVNRIEVFDKEGKPTAPISPDDFYVLDRASEIPGDEKILHVPVPGLEPGSRIEYEVTWEWKSRVDEFPYEEVFFFTEIPTQWMAVSVGTPGGDVGYDHSGMPEPTVSGDTLFWVAAPVKRSPRESYMPRLHDRGPWLALGGGRDGWHEVAASYLEDLSSFTADSSVIQTLAAELFAGATSQEEKLKRALSYARDELTYQAVTFGVRGMIPNDCSTILANRFGDCKDHALLAYHLLREAGFEARLALVRIDGNIVPGLPSLMQFDHMIVACKNGDQYDFYDPTDKYTRVAGGPPLALGGQSALVLDPEMSRLISIDGYPADFSRILVEKDLSIDAVGVMRGVETIEVSGLVASDFRSWMLNMDPGEWTESFSSLFAGYGVSVIDEVVPANLKALDEPLRITFEYKIRPIEAGERLRLLNLPLLWERYYFEHADYSRRFNRVHIEYPLLMETRTRVRLDEELSVESFPAEGQFEDDAPNLKWHVRSSRQTNDFVREIALQLPSGLFPAEEFGAFAGACRAAMKAASGHFMVRIPEPNSF